MKRDMDLIRQILLKTEEQPPNLNVVDLSFPEVDVATIGEHVHLLDEAGLVEAIDCSSRAGIDWKPMRLTWIGHEFLDASRNETVWQKAKTTLKEKGLGISYELMKVVLIEGTKQILFKPH
jgi:hypothetical protein